MSSLVKYWTKTYLVACMAHYLFKCTWVCLQAATRFTNINSYSGRVGKGISCPYITSFHWRELPLIPTGISYNIPYKVWDKITYSVPNFNSVLQLCVMSFAYMISWKCYTTLSLAICRYDPFGLARSWMYSQLVTPLISLVAKNKDKLFSIIIHYS